ncbi:MAG TPA: hypothetical protein ENH85_03240 [Candidatus Scalindua sp.]|nr:hypothetical protein [Candidatus Scalindua sp.]
MINTKYEHVGDSITKLIEECSELIHILCKAERFGWDNWHPDDPEKKTNKSLVLSEIIDVEKQIRELCRRVLLRKTKQVT